jgi:hypothetical protein
VPLLILPVVLVVILPPALLVVPLVRQENIAALQHLPAVLTAQEDTTVLHMETLLVLAMVVVRVVIIVQQVVLAQCKIGVHRELILIHIPIRQPIV